MGSASESYASWAGPVSIEVDGPSSYREGSGADPNAEHTHPINGYTPLMLAVETDEAQVAKALKEAGGDTEKVYLDPQTKGPMNVSYRFLWIGSVCKHVNPCSISALGFARN